jgi:hypothetical protein
LVEAVVDNAKAWRRIGLLAPATIMAAVPVAALVVTNWTWAAWMAAGLSAAVVTGGAWMALDGVASVRRAASATASVAVSAGAVYFLLTVVWGLAVSDQGLVSPFAGYAFVFGPWVVLLGGGTAARRAGRTKGAPPSIPWWLAALAACALAYPLVMWTTTVSDADDMAALVLFFIPAFALGLWTGPLATVALACSIARRAPAKEIS